jgi:hypothetical protein
MPKSSYPVCPGKEKCPLKREHPENGPESSSEFFMGCQMCDAKNSQGKDFVEAMAMPAVPAYRPFAMPLGMGLPYMLPMDLPPMPMAPIYPRKRGRRYAAPKAPAPPKRKKR